MSCTEWIDFSQKNKPQGNALATGILILFTCGTQIGWIYQANIPSLPWAHNHSNLVVVLTYCAFYVMAIAGAYLAALVSERLTKKNIYFTACTLAIFGSACVAVMSKSLYLIMAARLLIGITYGYVYVTCLVHAAEIMTQALRGTIVATLNFVVIAGVLMTTSHLMSTDVESYKEGFSVMQILGVTMLIFPILGMIFLPLFTRESPVHLMTQKKYDKAMELMIKVRNETEETWSIRNAFQELKTMVEEDQQMSRNIFHDGNERPILLVTLLKVCSFLAFNYGVNMIRMSNLGTLFVDEDKHINSSGVVLICIRMIAGMVTLFTIDNNIGRKKNLLISNCGTGAAFIVLGICILFLNNVYVIVFLQFLIEIFGGIGIGSVADVYTSEAFSTFKKPTSIFLTSSIEFGLHILAIALCFGAEITDLYSAIILFASGGLLLFLTKYLNKTLPETAKMSIRQTRNEFLKSGEIVFSGGNQMPPKQISYY